MSIFYHQTQTLHLKIVYCGPSGSGKSCTLQAIYERLPAGRLVNVRAKGKRDIIFDVLPIHLGHVEGVRVRLDLYTVPGDSHMTFSRKRLLQGVDGVVFVADANSNRLLANASALSDLQKLLADQPYDVAHLPLVVQANKQDADHIAPLTLLQTTLSLSEDTPVITSSALSGEGVMEALDRVVDKVLARLEA